MHRRFLSAALVVAAMASGAGSAVAADGDTPEWTTCRGGKEVSQDDRIVACSTIISSGTESGLKLATAYRFRGDAYTANSQRDLAVASYRGAIEADGANEASYLNSICWTLATLAGNVDDALRACNRSIQLKNNPHTYDSRGLVNLKLNKNQDALRDYEFSLKFNAKSASSLYGKSIALRRMGRTREADEAKNAAIGVDGWIMHKFTKWGVMADGSVG